MIDPNQILAGGVVDRLLPYQAGQACVKHWYISTLGLLQMSVVSKAQCRERAVRFRRQASFGHLQTVLRSHRYALDPFKPRIPRLFLSPRLRNAIMTSTSGSPA